MPIKIVQKRLLCPRCGNITTIFRCRAREKGEGHYKKLYCYKCKTTHNHIELKSDYDYTDEEINDLIHKMIEDNKYDTEESDVNV